MQSEAGSPQFNNSLIKRVAGCCMANSFRGATMEQSLQEFLHYQYRFRIME